jgi:predicted ATPase
MLPAQRTSFIGRERELSALGGLLSQHEVRLVTLTGPGGIGKTRLALAAAENAVDAFTDGIAFVWLAAVRAPELVPAVIAQALDVHEAANQSMVERVANAIGTQRLLLVLDNFEHLIDAADVVGQLLDACPQLTVLVTSRAALHLSGERLVRVPPLAVPDAERVLPSDQVSQVDAVRLFVERARSARDDFDPGDASASVIGSICARLDGVPLAIELAAARVRVLSPQALLAHLEHRLRLLTGGPQDQPARLQTMNNTIAWSYDLLSPAQQALFRHLSVFAGGCTMEMAEIVCGGVDLDVLEGLSVLVDHSLLGQVEHADGSGRFTMLETIREYAFDQLERSGDAAEVQGRHARACFAFVEAGYPWAREFGTSGERHLYLISTRPGLGEHDIRNWLARVEPEHANLRAALTWFLDTNEDELALRLAAALGKFW